MRAPTWRANSPLNVLDELASNDEPFGPIRRQDIAVIFADIIGFTAYTEDNPAEQASNCCANSTAAWRR